MIASALEQWEADPVRGAALHGRRLGLGEKETQEYLEGFNFRLGERERLAMETFRALIAHSTTMTVEKS
jgi:predicted solute-binding protein